MNKKIKVIFVCTGNSCRSQMAEGLLRHIDDDRFEVFSAGTTPSRVHPMSIRVMKETGIDISTHTSDPLDKYFGYGIDYVITLCDNAREFCPTFPGDAKKIHWSIDDPFRSWKNDYKIVGRYRKTRDEIQERLEQFIKLI
jgi:arsenate reductase